MNSIGKITVLIPIAYSRTCQVSHRWIGDSLPHTQASDMEDVQIEETEEIEEIEEEIEETEETEAVAVEGEAAA